MARTVQAYPGIKIQGIGDSDVDYAVNLLKKLKEDKTYKSIDDAPPWFEKDSESLQFTTSIPNS